jgi:hypothetical protein
MIEEICFVISAHPSTEHRTSVLKECLESLSEIGVPRIVAAHCLPCEKIDHLCEHYVYDYENVYIEKEELIEVLNPGSSHFYAKMESIQYRSQLNLFIAIGSHQFSAFKNMVNGANLAKERGFKYMFYTEGDNVFDKEDVLRNMDNYIESIKEGKKGVFFRGHHSGLNAISTLIYFVEIDFFLEKVRDLKTKAGWLQHAKKIGNSTAEKIFLDIFENSEHVKLFFQSYPDYGLNEFFPRSTNNSLFYAGTEENLIANFCAEFSTDSDSTSHHWFCFVEKNRPQRVSSRVFLRGEEVISISENFSEGEKWKVLSTDLNFLFEEPRLDFLNTYFYEDWTEERKFSVSGKQLQMLLQLNTVEFKQ